MKLFEREEVRNLREMLLIGLHSYSEVDRIHDHINFLRARGNVVSN